ncbi:glycosyltransferase family 4 protein [Halorubrum sp. T3]|uniref:glycosyltransferase family 4 protein n=1 Tax=Halorubrum sp. T3 TaxID=1194088 RepID=UPI0012BAA397|nr:glycosyltransferase family 4 protein [Halorubrum sp. T3]
MNEIAMVGPAEGESGIGDYISDLTSEMTNSKIEKIEIPVDSNNPLIFAERAIRIGRTDVTAIHLQHEYGLFGSMSMMSWIFFPLLYVSAALKTTPVIITIHEGLNEDLVVEPAKRLKKLYLSTLNRMIILNASHVIFLSENTAEEFTESVKLTTYTVLPHGAHTDPVVELEQKEAKQQLGYDSKEVLITEPGYIEPRKGSHKFIELSERMGDFEFLLAGGPSKQAYEDYVEDIRHRAPPNLTLTGVLGEEEFHASFIASDIIVLPYQVTEQGGIVNTVNQSGILNRCATYGKPVIASELPYFQDLKEDWSCIQICNFENMAKAEERIRELVSNKEEQCRLSDQVREYAESQSFSKVAKRHEQIYESL